jgi:serine/threonine protein kinase
MAPEIKSGNEKKNYTNISDVYSLGIILHFIF